MKHLVEIKMVPVQKLYGIGIGVETHLLCFIVLNYVTLTDDGSWVNWNVEWSTNVFLLEWTPVKSGDTALHDGEFLNAEFVLHVFIVEGIEFMRFVLYNEFASGKFCVECDEFTGLDALLDELEFLFKVTQIYFHMKTLLI